MKKKYSFHTKGGSPQKSQNICIHFKAHQDRLTFLGEAYGLLNSHLEQDLLSSKSYSRTIYLHIEWLNKEKNVFLSPRKHKEMNSSSSFVKDTAKHYYKSSQVFTLRDYALNIWNNSKKSLKQKNSRKAFLENYIQPKTTSLKQGISILKDKTLSS